MATEVTLELVEPYHSDVGRGIVRIDPDTLERLNVRPGQHIAIRGQRRTTARVWRSDKNDWSNDAIYADDYVRKNCRARYGERVTLEQVNLEPARELVAAQIDGVDFDFSTSAAGIVKRLLIGSSAGEGDLLAKTADIDSLYENPPRDTPFQPITVVETVPDSPVIVTEGTEVQITE